MEMEMYSRVKGSIKTVLGIDLDHYKDEQMRRRLDSWLSRVAAPSWEDYFERVRRDGDELIRFRNHLTINVTEFFRDIERWNYLKNNILPALIQDAPRHHEGKVGLRAWSAGCSIGAEPFTLVMILDELAPGRFHRLLGTDLDKGALQKARTGGPFMAEEVKAINEKQKAAYFKPDGPPFFVTEKTIERVAFAEQNMITEKFENDFDLIICRNVVIYFTGETKDRLFRKFAQSLRPGGILFIGGTEIIPHPQDYGLRGNGISFYAKI